MSAISDFVAKQQAINESVAASLTAISAKISGMQVVSAGEQSALDGLVAGGTALQAQATAAAA